MLVGGLLAWKGGEFVGLLLGDYRGSLGLCGCQGSGADPVSPWRVQALPTDLPPGSPEFGVRPRPMDLRRCLLLALDDEFLLRLS